MTWWAIDPRPDPSRRDALVAALAAVGEAPVETSCRPLEAVDWTIRWRDGLRPVNTALLPAIVAALRPGGLAIFSGMEEMEAKTFRPVLAAAGLTVSDEVVDAGWWAVAAARP